MHRLGRFASHAPNATMAWLAATLTLTLALTAAVLAAVNGVPLRDFIDQNGLFAVMISVTLPPIGAVIASHHPRNPIGWIYIAVPFFESAALAVGEYGRYGIFTDPGSLVGADVASWLQNFIWFPGLGIFLAFAFILFPDGRSPSPRWRWVTRLGGLAVPLATLGLAVTIWPYRGRRMYLDQPDLGVGPWTMMFLVGIIIVFLVGLLGMVSLVVRYRASDKEGKLQLRWMLFAALLAIVTVTGGFILPSFMGSLLQSLTVPLLAVAVAIAILRYRLYDIDRLISRTLTYGILTALLIGGYASMVLLLRSLLPIADDSPVVTGASTLAAAALFRPLRTRLKDDIDRRFNRRRYDASRAIEAFSLRLRQETDIEVAAEDLIRVAAELFEPSHASLWLRPPHHVPGRVPAAS